MKPTKRNSIFQTPSYVFYELLVRLNECCARFGDYVTVKKTHSNYILYTTAGTIEFPFEVLQRQFDDPQLLTPTDIASLMHCFKPFFPAYHG